MCVRTKVDYGCGHAYRTTVDCTSPDCSGLDKYLITKEGDCRACKTGSASGTRGRNGLGRYAQVIRQRERSRSTSYAQASRDTSVESATRQTTKTTPRHDSCVSPWAAPLVREKPWESPHRKQADEGWISEHEDRISDLQLRLENVHVSRQYEPQPSRFPYEVEDEEEAEEEYEEEESAHEEDLLSNLPRQKTHYTLEESPAARHCTSETRRRIDHTPSQRSRSGSYLQEVRQYSYDSLPDSMPSYSSSPRYETQLTTRYVYGDRPSEHEQYSGQSTPYATVKRSSGRARTEPYKYARSSAGHEYDYEHAHPLIGQSVYSYHSPKYYQPQRHAAYRYKPPIPAQVGPSYMRYQTRY